MSRFTIRVCVAVIFAGSLAATMPARGDDRSADAILKEIDAITLPEADLSRVNDKAYIQQFMKQRSEIRVRRAELIGELYRADPDNPRLATLLPVRWRSLSGRMGGPDDNEGARDLTGELNEVLARSKSDELKTEAAYIKAWIASDPSTAWAPRKTTPRRRKPSTSSSRSPPRTNAGPSSSILLSLPFKDEPARQKALYARIVKEYPDSERAEVARGILRRLDAVGKPFDLAFNDAISGAEISMKRPPRQGRRRRLLGDLVRPVRRRDAHDEEALRRVQDKGVEFIGVSLDQPKEGGLDKLKAFVAKERIAWPQYYQGDGWESEFSTSWGINAIPAVFLVDQEGKLFSVEARGKLETMIPELLNRRTPVEH